MEQNNNLNGKPKNQAPEPIKASPVISGKAKTSKGSRLVRALIKEDPLVIASRLFDTRLVPAIKQLIINSVADILGTTPNKVSQAPNNGGGVYTPYQQYFTQNPYMMQSPGTIPPVGNVYDYVNVSYETRDDAELVLASMVGLIRQQGYVTVANMYDLSKLPNMIKTVDHNYGWKNLDNIGPKMRIDGRWGIPLPNATPVV